MHYNPERRAWRGRSYKNEYEELAALVEFHTSALGRRIAAKQADNSNFHRAFASVETLARQILGIGPVGES
jgi:hypothetical protein